jgi:hypothetical protein
MVGGPADTSCLDTYPQSSALSEGWCYFFPASFLDWTWYAEFLGDGRGWYENYRHDMGYADLCQIGSSCSHGSDGAIWTGTLWELREAMISAHPDDGLDRLHRIVLEGMAQVPCNPSMLDARDGILQADAVLYGSSHEAILWDVFARRGMGENASTTGASDTSPVTDHTVPTGLECAPPATPTGLTAAAEGDNAVRLNYDAAGASSVEIWRDDLDNTVDRAVRIGFTTDTATYLDTEVQGGKQYRYHLVALGEAGTGCSSGGSATADATTGGACEALPFFVPDLVVSEGMADCSVLLTWTAAQEGCPGSGEPIVYSVYRGPVPGFEPSRRWLIGFTTDTSFEDVPPEDGGVPYYLVLAQHGTLDDDVSHHDRENSQVYRWVPRIPTLERSTVEFWDFESGDQGWTVDNTPDPAGAWDRVSPHSTRRSGVPFAPETAAGGSGYAWVTGDAPTSTSINEHDCDGPNELISPTWDGTGGATILSFDYWSFSEAAPWGGGLIVRIHNGSTEVDVVAVNRMTTQSFDSSSRHGWQRAELNLADHITPTSTMTVTFIGNRASRPNEVGVDNVRIETATTCSRSALAIDTVTLDDTPAGWGNGNGLLEPGETATLRYTLRNDGTATAFSPTGTASRGTPGLVIHDDTSSWSDIPPAGTGAPTDDGIVVSLPHGLTCGDTIILYLELTDAAGTLAREQWTNETGDSATDVLLADTFESDLGWTVDGPGPGGGVWERGDPVGTTYGTDQANPEDDSPNDAGSFCYVTENGPVGGDPNANDVDLEYTTLYSPPIDFSGYKRARQSYDLWYYENTMYFPDDQDYFFTTVTVEGGEVDLLIYTLFGTSTGGWTTKHQDLTESVPMIPDVRLTYWAIDHDETWSIFYQDNVVEAALDNVLVEADRPVCDLSGIDPPNPVGNTLRVDKDGSDTEMSWQVPASDAGHDPAAYYDIHVSGAPDSGFVVEDSTLDTTSRRPIDSPDEYFVVVSVNAAGMGDSTPTP